MEKIDIIIVGAGVVGLAIARELATKGLDVLIIEAEGSVASVTSARNSGVLHAGFYKPESIKFQACVSGRHKLYAYAKTRGIPFKKCGKLVVATDSSQVATLHEMKARVESFGVDHLRIISATEAKEMEPELNCVAALLSPDTGVIDVHSYAMALLGEAEAHGATLALHAPVLGGEITSNGFILNIGGPSPTTLACRLLINAAGLGAQKIAHHLRGLPASTIPPQVLAKGNYFSLSGPNPFKMLIYPVPVIGSMGLHAGSDMAGRVRFGPDLEWVDRIDYGVDSSRVTLFEETVRRYWPSLPKGALNPDYCGIRPKLSRGSHQDSDFMIQTEADHRIHNLVNLYGIESPGLTSSLALAEMVTHKLT